MKHYFPLSLLFVSLVAGAVDVNLRFDPVVGATGYRIESTTLTCTVAGALWGDPQDTAGATTYLYRNVPEDTLVLFRAVAYNDSKEAIREYSGAWYDHRLLLPSPGGAGIQ